MNIHPDLIAASKTLNALILNSRTIINRYEKGTSNLKKAIELQKTLIKNAQKALNTLQTEIEKGTKECPGD
ncbi:MAG TPA: hypothetical protein EYP59_14490 [Thiotrichaceae bacterium]|nr:hypothetical protein [Thiotrichaceae bacterium]